MNNQIPSTPSFYAVGHLTGGEVWLAPDLPTLIGDLIGDEEYLLRDKAGRLTARERAASQLATRSQAALLQAAVHEESWSWEGASLNEIDRLTRAREITDRDGH